MFKKTPCYGCTRPERLPNGLCEKNCKDKADYLAEKAEYIKQEQIRKGLNYYTGCIINRAKKKSNNFRHGGREI